MSKAGDNASVAQGANTPSLSGQEALSAEVRVRESDRDEPARHERETAKLPAADEAVVRLLVLGAVLLMAGVYVGGHIGSGWVPADEGALSQSALRALGGQLPHQDFAEIYTGGLSLIHAVAFRAFGVNLMALRMSVFLFFLIWVPVVYYIALRFTSALSAGLITLLAVAWSFPNYPAAMPSWYNLFFATFGAAALLRYLEVRKARWLFVAGVCGGVSILIKVVGAYYIAGVLLFLAFLEQDDHEPRGSGDRAIPYRLFSGGALILFAISVIYFFHAQLGVSELYHFVLPPAALAGLILLSERNVRTVRTQERFRALFRLILPFAAGVVAPIALFLAPYATSGALHAFFSGVTSSAVAHATGLGVIRPLGVDKALYALVLIGIVAAAMYLEAFQGRIVGACLGLVLAVLLWQSTQAIISGVWFSVATLTPLIVLSGVAVLFATRKSNNLTKLEQQRIMLLISLAAVCSFVQHPFAAPIYLSYSLPLTLLAAAAIVGTMKKQPGTYVLASVMGFYLLFGVIRLVPDYIYELTHKVGLMQELRLERAGGLRIEFAPAVEQLVHVIQQHATNGLLYAGNDCPEFYFLAGLKNVTSNDGGATPDEVLRALQSTDVKVVVINEAPFFPSGQMNPEVRAEIARRFPQSQMFGIFHVYWRQ
jgi:Dolichyl-phosphate-mannose-protein mannosyltransferase